VTPDPLREHIARLEPWLDDPENGTYPTYSVPLFAAGEGEATATARGQDTKSPSPAAPPVEHRSIGKVYEPNGWGDCEACGRPWPCPQARIDYMGSVGITPPHVVNAAPQEAPTEPPTWQQAEDVYGFDAMREPLRAAAPDRCDECGGLVKGFFANFLRRCPNDWHIVREEWEHGLGRAPQGEGNTDGLG